MFSNLVKQSSQLVFLRKFLYKCLKTIAVKAAFLQYENKFFTVKKNYTEKTLFSLQGCFLQWREQNTNLWLRHVFSVSHLASFPSIFLHAYWYEPSFSVMAKKILFVIVVFHIIRRQYLLYKSYLWRIFSHSLAITSMGEFSFHLCHDRKKGSCILYWYWHIKAQTIT